MRAPALAGLGAATPVAALLLLFARPELDVTWEHHPAHLWLVLVAGALNFGLGYLLGEAARRRGDSRVFLVSLVFLATAGFLVLHALATPGVFLAGRNAGFVVATPIGLLLGGVLAAASALRWETGRDLLARRQGAVRAALLALLVAWAIVSLADLPPLDEPLPEEESRGPLVALALVGTALYGFAALRYGALYLRRRAPLVLAVVLSFVLLAEAMVAVAFARSWRLSWWEWHLLMLAAFALVAYRVRAEWRVEGSTAEIFADLYTERTLGSQEEASILFADLQGFTSFSARTEPAAVKAMLDEYFGAAAAVVLAHGGRVEKTIGDALMAVFRGPGHPLRAAAAALAFQEQMEEIASGHPGWPRFRAGLDGGLVAFGLVAARGAREITPTGDAVNVASRLEGLARTGEVVIGAATRAALGSGAEVEDLGEMKVKGRDEPVRAYVLRAVPADRSEGDESLEDE